ncbi:hypothetical protein AB0G42_16625 [Streptomyces yangpuensis]|uniref:hypothetical protein n=1 Tax=Streptomyces yangpuensis TaxID=1648182 RepID=UPI00342EC441
MNRHLIDAVPVAWSGLGTDLLDGAPEALVNELTGGQHHPSKQMNELISPDGSPPRRMSVREGETGGLDWGYVLHEHGIEVISLREELRGPVVGWGTDPRMRFSDRPALWQLTGPVPCREPQPPKLSTTTVVPPTPAPTAAAPIARR